MSWHMKKTKENGGDEKIKTEKQVRGRTEKRIRVRRREEGKNRKTEEGGG